MEFVSGDRITRLIANTSKAYEARGGREVGTEDIATIMFETQRGAAGTLTVSQVSLGRKNQLLIELSGSQASFTFNQERPDSMLIGGMTSSQIVTSGQETLSSGDARRLSQVPSGHPQGYQDAFNSFVADAYSGFLGDVRPGVPGLADGLRSAALVDAVLESAESGTWVDVAAQKQQNSTSLLPN
jgi:predicted dehydrogenase